MARDVDAITADIVDASIKLHMQLGPGLLESVYELILARDLERRGLLVARQQPITFDFDGMRFEDAFRLDLLVENEVIVEIKSIEKLAPVHSKQVLTYLRLLNRPVALLINFGEAILKDGLHRVVNKYSSSLSASPRAAHTAACLTGVSPVMVIDCFPCSDSRHQFGVTRLVKARQ